MMDALKKAVFVDAANQYAQYILEWSVRKGFREWEFVDYKDSEGFTHGSRKLKERNFGEQVALIHSELSEMLEAHRCQKGEPIPDKHCPEFSNLEIEMADTIIRCLDLSAAYGFRIGEAIEAKMQANEKRPERHGKNY